MNLLNGVLAFWEMKGQIPLSFFANVQTGTAAFAVKNFVWYNNKVSQNIKF